MSGMHARLDKLVLLAWVLGAGTFVLLALRLPSGAVTDALGPRVFPVAVAGTIVLCALWLLTEPWRSSLLAKSRQARGAGEVGEVEEEDESGDEGQIITPWRIPATAGIIAAYITLMPAVGYRAATALACLAMLLMMRVGRRRTLILLPIITSLALYWIFNDLMSVMLP